MVDITRIHRKHYSHVRRSKRLFDAQPLSSVVAVVLGGTRLSGGAGSIIGSIMDAIVYYILKNVVAFTVFRTGLTPHWQTLIDGMVVILALAGPGLARLLRSRRST